MRRDLTAPSAGGHDEIARDGSHGSSWRFWRLGAAPLTGLLGAALLGALLLALCYQVPAAHPVDVGGYDAAYTQGFFDPERAAQPGDRPYLTGSDGSARWSRGVSYLVFPQIGLPAELTLRVRGRGEPTELTLLLNGDEPLGTFAVGPEWRELTLPVRGGLLKPSDVVIELRAAPGRPSESDARQVGVLVDRAALRTAALPILPYPAQLALGGLAAALLWGLARRTQGDARGVPQTAVRPLPFALGLAALALAFLALYRLQPPYPHPIRWLLPAACALLGGAAALRFGPALARRAPALLDAAALGGVAAWSAATLAAAQEHVTLSVPGVEKDFRVFATRAFDLGEVFRADGFYNLGYPLLLWLATPLAQGNPFLAARALAALSGAALLLATWWLARSLLGRGPALLALAALALSPMVAQYGLYVGSDMPFAALCALALAALAGMQQANGKTPPLVLLAAMAGLLGGSAFLIRHPGLLLLPLGLAWIARLRMADGRWQMGEWMIYRRRAWLAAVFACAFVLAISPQIYVNLRDTGEPLYSQQAKNIWLAVFGGGDWGRWGETSDDVTLGEVLRQDPGRFFASWWGNVRGFFGTGGEDTSEFGRAYQLRLLGFPASWLALAGLLGWLLAEGAARPRRFSGVPALLLAWVGLYVAAVSVGISLPRFFLPLAPVYALAAAWAAWWAAGALAGALGAGDTAPGAGRGAALAAAAGEPAHAPRALAAIGLVLVALLWGGFGVGARYVLANQPADEVAAARLVLASLTGGERLVVRDTPRGALDKYSAIAHLTVPPPAADDPAALRAAGAAYLLWSEEVGRAPEIGAAVGDAGRYRLIRLE